MSREILPYPESRPAGRQGVVVTAAAGTGIGFATAKRCAEEGARVVISDHHERRLTEAADTIAEAVGERPTPSSATSPTTTRSGRWSTARPSPRWHRRHGQQCRPRRRGRPRRHDRRPVGRGARRHPQRHLPDHRAALRHMPPGHGRHRQQRLGPRLAQRARPTTPPRPGSWPSPGALPSAPAPASGSTLSPPAWPPTRSREGHERRPARRTGGQGGLRPGRHAWEVANVIVFLASDYSSYMTGEVVAVSSQRA